MFTLWAMAQALGLDITDHHKRMVNGISKVSMNILLLSMPTTE